MALTETEIKTFKPDPKRDIWKSDGAGLYLRIQSRGLLSWVWRRKRAGVTSYTTIGEWPNLSVKAARTALAKRTGHATPANALTVKDALDEWFDDQIAPKYRVTRNIRVYVDRAIAEFGNRRLQELNRAEIARFVRGYGKRAPVAANRCLSNLKLAFGWCVETGYLEHNPADGLTKRVAGGDEESRNRVLNDAELRTLWRLESPNANLLRALLLSGCRIAELQHAATNRVDGDWLLIPAAHSKNGLSHRVFLVPETRAQFNGSPPLLFRSVSPTAVQAWIRRMQADEDGTPREPWASIRPLDPESGQPMPSWTPHDLRRTFSTRLHSIGVAPHVVEKLLNHKPQGIAAVYNRADLVPERIEASRKWAAELARITKTR